MNDLFSFLIQEAYAVKVLSDFPHLQDLSLGAVCDGGHT